MCHLLRHHLLLLLLILLVLIDIGLRLRQPELAPTVPTPAANPTAAATFPPDAAAQPQTIRVAVQCYQRGVMIWRSDSGAIYGLAGDADGAVFVYQGGAYADLPDARGHPPQADLLLPASGFGKVWAAHEVLRSRLGWATQAEAAHDALITPYATRLLIALPDVGAFDISYRGFFRFTGLRERGVCG
jgi:hypothetical protein